MIVRRSILVCTALLAFCAPPALAHGPVYHDDTAQELAGVDIAQSVALPCGSPGPLQPVA
jgi:hypothetical protein